MPPVLRLTSSVASSGVALSSTMSVSVIVDELELITRYPNVRVEPTATVGPLVLASWPLTVLTKPSPLMPV